MSHRAVGVLCGLALLASAVSVALAAVVIADFAVEAREDRVLVTWETGSEIGNLGFYVWRSERAESGYVQLPLGASQQFIPSEDSGVGARYVFEDLQVTPGALYYYKVQDVPADGGAGAMVGPEAAGIGIVTPTPTSLPSATPSPAAPTDEPQPSATATLTPLPIPTSGRRLPLVWFWADPVSLEAGACSTVQWQTEGVRAVYFDGEGVSGQGGRTFCPCESDTHTLTVQHQDGHLETLTVELIVNGTCWDAMHPSATPLPATSQTPRVTIGAEDEQEEVATPVSVAISEEPISVSPTPEATIQTRTAAPSPISTPTPDGASEGEELSNAPPEVSGDADASALSRQAVEASTPLRPSPLWLWVLLGGIGVGLLTGGVWVWRRA